VHALTASNCPLVLDTATLRYSYKQTCLVTLEVGDVENQEEWHLPTYDPHNRNKYHYKLHSLDIYFWTQDDALQFVNGIRRVLPPQQCEVLDEPGPPARQPGDMSSLLVQRLEQAAISQPQGQRGGAANGPPPMSAVSGSSASPPGGFVPMAYNPAAPAAPEAVRPREKTPPPDDGVANPLQQTLASDAATPFSPGLVPSGLGPLSPGVPPPQYHQSPIGAPSFAPPPQHSVLSPGLPPAGFGQTHPGLQRAVTVPITPGMANPYGAAFPGSPSFAPPPAAVSAAVVAGPPAHGMASPGPPPGGYSQFSYSNPAVDQASLAGQGQYGVHQHFYRPTAEEMSHGAKPAKPGQPKVEGRAKLEENAGRIERGVTGMLKKFEKKFG
jgi:hypothetical protein